MSTTYFEVLRPRAGPEVRDVWLVPEVENKAVKHIILNKVILESLEECISQAPVAVVARERRDTAAICSPEVMYQQDEIATVMARGAIIGQCRIKATNVVFQACDPSFGLW